MFLATAVQSGDEPLLEGRSYSHALVVVYSALRLALVAHEQRASTTTQTYEETLVHEVMDGEWANVPTGVAGAPHRFATARSDALGDLLKTENLWSPRQADGGVSAAQSRQRPFVQRASLRRYGTLLRRTG
jgi:hypothetical protein